MDASLQLVSEFCGAQLMAYMNCVGTNPTKWQTECDSLKMDLASCAQENETIKFIKVNCSSQFSSYDSCMKRNPNDLSLCLSTLEAFMACADKVSGGAGKSAK